MSDPSAANNHEETPWWNFSTSDRVIFGRGVARMAGNAVRELGERVLVCTDVNLVRAGTMEPVLESLRESSSAEVFVFDGGEPEIDFPGVERCFAAVRDFRPSVVVGVGGGSNLDLAKVIAARFCEDRPIALWRTEGIPTRALPVVALPTTAGTGSEVTSIAVLTDDESHLKVGFQSRSLRPQVALVDPLLTVTCPPRVTAHSGMDALTHAIESYTAIDFADKPIPRYEDHGFIGRNPVSDALALRATELIGLYLVRAYEDGSDLEAREGMALGSLLAGMAFATAGTSIVHALQYPLGNLTKTTHGHGNAVLLPAAIEYNLSARTPETARLARALGSSELDDQAAASSLAHLVRDLATQVGVEPGLQSIGVVSDDLEPMALAASGITRLTSNNARPIDQSALLEVLQLAYGDVAPATASGT